MNKFGTYRLGSYILQRVMKLFIIATMVSMAVGDLYAQNAKAPIPNPEWPLDSVVNGMIKKFTVQGDSYYDKPSDFVWTVKGGRIFFDEGLTLPAQGKVDTIKGNSKNSSSIWVVWDSFDTPLDTGYVYAYEISADNCQRDDSDPGKFVGRRVKVSAPPDAFFLSDQTLVCNDENEISILLKIQGMPPYDITYKVNGKEQTLHLTMDDMKDFDLDGLAEEYAFIHTGFKGITTDKVVEYELIEASSGGVIGHILPEYPTHKLVVHVIPDAPEIVEDYIEVTKGQTHQYIMTGAKNVLQYNWMLLTAEGDLLEEQNSATDSTVNITFDYEPGKYMLIASYFDINGLNDIMGCESLSDTLIIDLFAQPFIGFNENDVIITCSPVSLVPTEKFDFDIEYEGARPYSFRVVVYDYNGLNVWEQVFENEYENSHHISIDNAFINDDDPEIDRTWTVKIETATNNEGLDVQLIEGHGERRIIIHPKPFIDGQIDFGN